MEFKQWFCLNGRESFTIDPKVNPDDARFYFGRPQIVKDIKKQLRRSFIDPRVPKLIIFGPYGSGKTQLLYHIDYLLTHETPDTCKLKPHIVHLDMEMKSKSDHRHWHLQLMEALNKEIVTGWVESISKKVPNIEDELKNIFKDPNVAEAIRKLLIGGLEHTAWRWLCGQELSAKDLEQLKVTRNLGFIGARDMAQALISIGNLAEIIGIKLVFMMDEAERFTAVKTGDGTEYLTDYLRELTEISNMSIGFMLAGTAQAANELPSVFQHGAVVRRLGKDNYIDIPYLSAVDDVMIFLKELLRELVNQKEAEKRIKEHSLETRLEIYPFDDESFEILCQYATEDPTKALPSHLIHCLNECAIEAWDNKKHIIDKDIVNNNAPTIFG